MIYFKTLAPEVCVQKLFCFCFSISTKILSCYAFQRPVHSESVEMTPNSSCGQNFSDLDKIIT